MSNSRPKTLAALLRPEVVDSLVFQMTQGDSFEEEKFFNHSGQSSKMDIAVRLADAHVSFEVICLKSKHDQYWCDEAAALLSAVVENPEIKPELYQVPGVTCFDRARGLYFFEKSLAFRDESAVISHGEVEFLQKAMSFHSIHAMQRYHEYCYQQAINDPAGAESVLKAVIKDCQSVREAYGSYADLMLAEAYVHYGAYCLQEKSDRSTAVMAFKAALKCCDRAAAVLLESQSAIADASLGAGLSRSNALGIENPVEARERITEMMQSMLNSNNDLKVISGLKN